MAQFTYEDTFSKVADIVADKLSIDKSRITPNSTMAELGADSLDLVEIIMKLEESFGLEISDEDAEHMSSLKQVVEYIQQRRTK